jgi:actin-related protein
MSEIVKSQRISRLNPRNEIQLGEWRWIQVESDEDQSDEEKDRKYTEELMCCFHKASNHVEFYRNSVGGGTESVKISYQELEALTRPEPNWQNVLQEKQKELQAAVQSMIDLVKNAELLPEENQPPTLLPSTLRRDPEAVKQSLISLKEESYPIAQENVFAVQGSSRKDG